MFLLLRTAMNLPPPSSMLFGAQHKRMLEATQARIPQIAPTMPGVPPAKPIIEKTELPHARVQCSQSRWVHGFRVYSGAAHKTKQAMTKHLALLASLGRLGLSEHMLLCGGGSAAAQDRAGARFSERLVPLSDTTLYGFTGLDGGLGAVVATRRDGQSTKEGA